MNKEKQYKKMLKSYRRKFYKIAKCAGETPFDYGPWLLFTEQFLRFMQDYYTLGINVLADGNPDRMPREESLGKALELFYQWINYFEDKHPDDISMTAYDEVRNSFFSFISKHIEEWWD